MKRLKLFASVCMCLVLAFGSLALTGCNKSGGPNSFTIWIAQGIPNEYYDNYSKNPVADYIAKKFGVTLNFQQPIAGEELSNFNNLIATGDYPDVMDISYYTQVGSVVDLYDNGHGAAIDITEYVENYMPNYKAFLAANPSVGKTAKVNGKYLNLITYSDALGEQWNGMCYRRDWVAKYGKHPVTNEAFTWDDGVLPSGDDYTDNVVFPSGGANPTTIADWEWMMEIFKNVPDCKYPMSLPYQGFYEVGNLVSSFGEGGGPYWYLDGDTVKFGATSNDFNAYLTRMKEWMLKGYIDPSFDERATDPFYMIDDSTVRQGKVGIWCGLSSQVGNRLELSAQPATQGIQVWGAAPPALDETKPPKVFFQDSMETAFSYIFTDKAKDKNLDKLFQALDFLYGSEGSIMRTLGLNKEQFEEYENEFMKSRGFTDGLIVVHENGKISNPDVLLQDGGMLQSACVGDKLVGLTFNSGRMPPTHDSINRWIDITSIGSIPQSLQNQKTEAENATYALNQTRIRTYMAVEVPKFIKGTKNLSGADWNAFKAMLEAHGASANTEILQAIYDRLV